MKVTWRTRKLRTWIKTDVYYMVGDRTLREAARIYWCDYWRRHPVLAWAGILVE
jgi:hypothetical protein